MARLEAPTQLFSCEYCEIFKNIFFKEHLWWLLLYYIIFLHFLLYIFINIIFLSLYLASISSCFLLSVLLKLWKHVILIVSEKTMNVKQNICFWLKKIVARSDKKLATWRKKSTDNPREESITATDPEEDPITEDSKKTLSLRTLKRILSMRNLKRSSGPSTISAPQINSFWFFGNGMWYSGWCE